MKLGCDLVEPVNFDKEIIDKVGEFWDIDEILGYMMRIVSL